MQRDQSVGLHGVQGATDVETAVIEFGSQLIHQDIKSLGTCRVETA